MKVSHLAGVGLLLCGAIGVTWVGSTWVNSAVREISTYNAVAERGETAVGTVDRVYRERSKGGRRSPSTVKYFPVYTFTMADGQEHDFVDRFDPHGRRGDITPGSTATLVYSLDPRVHGQHDVLRRLPMVFVLSDRTVETMRLTVVMTSLVPVTGALMGIGAGAWLVTGLRRPVEH